MAIIYVKAGENLQEKINSAASGDTLKLEQCATFEGDFILPTKDHGGLIIQSDIPLPPPGMRINPSFETNLATIKGLFVTQGPAYGYTLQGLRINCYENYYSTGLIQLGGQEAITSLDGLPSHFRIIQCYIEGDKKAGAKRGVQLNCKNSIVQDCVIRNIWSDFQDAQAVCGWNGPGPFSIINNYLEASGENVMFGGASPAIDHLIPSDIKIIHNHLTKPSSWRAGAQATKNLFELKNAQRVDFMYNHASGTWADAQAGWGIVLTPRTCEGGDYYWAVINDVLIEGNLIESEHGINIAGLDGYRENCGGGTAGSTNRITIRNNNLILSGNASWITQFLSGPKDITIENNSCFQSGGAIMAFDDPNHPTLQLKFYDNAMKFGTGILGSSAGGGNDALKIYAPDSLVKYNTWIGPFFDEWVKDPKWYPPDNVYVETVEEVKKGSGANVEIISQIADRVHLGYLNPNELPASLVEKLEVEFLSVNEWHAGALNHQL